VRRDFVRSAPNQLWVADITSMKTWQGWVHLAAVMDCLSRRIVGWATAQHIQSVAKPASCWDNIVAESFFATLKKERVYRRSWPLRRTLEMEIFEYIEIF